MAELPSLWLAALLHAGCQTAPPDPCVLVLPGGGVGQLAKGLEVVGEFWCLTDPAGVGFCAGGLGGMCHSVGHRGVAKYRKGHQKKSSWTGLTWVIEGDGPVEGSYTRNPFVGPAVA
jgi:hypothetical protein